MPQSLRSTFFLLLAVIVMLLAAIIYNVARTAERFAEINRFTNYLNDYREAATVGSLAAIDYSSLGHEEEHKEILTSLTTMNRIIEQMTADAQGTVYEGTVQEMAASNQEINILLTSVHDGTNELSTSELIHELNDATVADDNLKALIEQRRAEAHLDTASGRRINPITRIFLLALLLLLGTTFIWFLNVLRRVQRIERGALAIGSGDLDMRLPSTGRDELSSISNALNSMAGNLSQRIKDLTTAQDALGASEKRFRGMVENLPVGIMVQDAHAQPQLTNSIAQQLLPTISPLMGNGHSRAGLRFLREDGSEMAQEELPFQRAAATGEPQREVVVGVQAEDQSAPTWLLYNVEPQSGDEGQFLTTFNDITALRQAEEQRRYSQQLRTAADVVEQISTIHDPKHLLQATASLLQERFDLYHAHIYVLDEAGQSLKVEAGTGAAGRQMMEQGHAIPVSRENSIVAQAARSRTMVAIQDVRSNPLFMANALLPDTRSEAAVPLLAGDTLVGVLDVQDDQVNRFSEADLDVLSTVAGHIALSLENARLFSQVEASLADSQLRLRISQQLQATRTQDDVVRIALDELSKGSENPVIIQLLDDQSEPPMFVVRGAIGRASTAQIGDRYPATRIDPNDPDTIVVQDVESDSTIHPPIKKALVEGGVNSYISLRLRSAGRVFGSIGISSTQPNAFPEEDVQRYRILADMITPALRTTELNDTVERNLLNSQSRFAISQALAKAKSVREVLDAIISQAAIFPDTGVTVFTSDAPSDPLNANLTMERINFAEGQAPIVPLGTTLGPDAWPVMNQALATNTPYFVHDVSTDPDIPDSNRQALIAQNQKSSAIFPMLTGDQFLGVITVGAAQPDFFRDANRLFMYQSLADQGAAALNTARLSEQVGQSLENSNLRLRMSQSLQGARTQQEVLDAALDMMYGLHHQSLTAQLLDTTTTPPTFVLRATRGQPEGVESPIGQRYPATRIGPKDPETIVVQDVANNSTIPAPIREAVLAAGEAGFVSLRLSSAGRVFGAFAVSSGIPNDFPPELVEQYRLIADLVAPALRATELNEQVQQSLDETSVRLRMSQRLQQARTPDDVIAVAMDELALIPDSTHSVMTLDPDAPEATFVLRSTSSPDFPVGSRFPASLYRLDSQREHDTVQGVAVSNDVQSDPLVPLPLKQIFEGLGVQSYAGLEMYRGGQLFGAININTPHRNSFTPTIIETFRGFADLLGPALYAADLNAERERELAQTQSRLTISQALATAQTPDEVFQALFDQLKDQGSKHTVILSEHRADDQSDELILTVRHVVRPEGATAFFKVGDIIAGSQLPIIRVVKDGQSFHSADLLTDPATDPISKQVIQFAGVQSLIALPIRQGDTLYGAITVMSSEKGSFDAPEERYLYEEVAQQGGQALHIATLAEDSQRAAQQVAVAADLGAQLTSQSTLDELLSQTVEQVRERFGLYHAHIYLLDDEAQQLRMARGSGTVGEELLAKGHSIPLDREQSLVARAAREREVVSVANTALDPAFLPNPLLPDTKSEVAVPLVAGDRVLGVLDVQDDRPYRFDSVELGTFRTLAAQVSSALQNATLFGQVQQSLNTARLRLQLSQRLQTERTTEEVIAAAVEELSAIEGNTVSLFLLKEKAGQPYYELTASSTTVIPVGTHFPIDTYGQFGDPNDTSLGNVIVTNNIADDATMNERTRSTLLSIGMRSFMSLRIENGGQRLGVIAVTAPSVNAFPPDKVALYRSLTDLVGSSVYVTTLNEQVALNFEQTQTRFEISQALASADTEDKVLDVIMAQANRFPDTNISIMRSDMPATPLDATLTLVRQIEIHPESPMSPIGTTYPPDVFPILQQIMASNQTVFLHDALNNPEVDEVNREGLRSVGSQSAANIPLVVGTQAMGVLTILSPDPEYFRNESRNFLYQSLAEQGAQALYTARLSDEVETNLGQTQSRFEISQALAQAQTPDEVLDILIERIAILPKTRSSIILSNDPSAPQTSPATIVRTRVVDTEAFMLPVGTELPVGALEMMQDALGSERKLVYMSDVETDPHMPEVQRESMRQMGVISSLTAPLSRANQVIGILSTSAEKANAFDDPQMGFLIQTLAELGSEALTKAHLAEQAQRAARQMQIAADVGSGLTSQSDLETLLGQTVEQVRERFNLYHAHIYLLDGEEKVLRIASGSGEVGQKLRERGHNIPLNREQSLVARAARERQLVSVADTSLDPNFLPNPLLPNTRSEVAVPLVAGDRVLGVLDVQDEQPFRFDSVELETFRTLGSQISSALQNATLFGQVQESLADTRLRLRISQRLQTAQSQEEVLDVALDELHSRYPLPLTALQFGGTAEAPTATVKAERISGLPVGATFPLVAGPERSASTDLVVVHDIPNSPRIAEPAKQVMLAQGQKSFLGVTLSVGGKIFGTLNAATSEENAFDDAKVRVFQQVGQLISPALLTVSLNEQLQQSLDETSLRLRLSQQLQAARSQKQVVQIAIEALRELKPDAELLFMTVEGSGADMVVTMQEDTSHQTPIGTRFPFEERLGHSYVNRDVAANEIGLAEDIKQYVLSSGTKSYTQITLESAGRLFGIANLASGQTDDFDERTVRLSRSIGDLVAPALYATQLNEQIEETLAQAETRLEISQSLAMADSPADVLRILFEHVDAPEGTTVILGQTVETSDGSLAMAVRHLALAEGVPAILKVGDTISEVTMPTLTPLKDNQAYIGDDVLTDPRLDDATKQLLQSLKVHSIVALPLSGGGDLLGALMIQSNQVGFFKDPNRRYFLEELTAQGGQALLAATLSENAQRAAEQVAVAADLGTQLTSQSSLDELLIQTVEQVRDRFGLYHAHIYLLDDEAKQLRMAAGSGTVGAEMRAKGHSIPLDREHSLVARAARGRQLVAVSDTSLDPDFLPNPLLPNTRSEVAVPLVAGDKVLGVLDVQDNRAYRFDSVELETFRTLGSQISSALQNATLFGQVESNLKQTQNRFEISQALAQARTPDEVLDTLIERFSFVPKTRNSIILSNNPSAPSTAMATVVRSRSLETNALTTVVGTELPATTLELMRAALEQNLGLMHVTDVATNPDLPELHRQALMQLEVASFVSAPLVRGNQTIGILTSSSDVVNTFDDPDTLFLMRTLTELGSEALTKAYLAEQAQRAARQMQIASDVGAQLTSQSDLEMLLGQTVEQVHDRFDLYHAHIYLLDEGAKMLRIASGYGEAGEAMRREGHAIPLNREQSLVARAAREREVISVADTSLDPTFLPNPLLPKTRSEVAIPLMAGDKVLGVLDVQDSRPYRFDSVELETFRTLGSQISSALQNATLFGQVESNLAQTRTRFEISQALASADTEDKVLDVIMVQANRFPDTNISIMRSDMPANPLDATLTLVRQIEIHPESPMSPIGTTYPPGVFPILQQIMASNQTVFLHDALNNPEVDEINREGLRSVGSQSAANIPLVVGTQAMGVLTILSPDPEYFRNESRNFLYQSLAEQGAQALYTARLSDEVETNLKQAETRFEISQALATANSEAEVIDAIAEAATRLEKVQVAVLLSDQLLTPLAANLTYVRVRSAEDSKVLTMPTQLGMTLPPEAYPDLQRALAARGTTIMPDILNNPDINPMVRMGMEAQNAMSGGTFPLVVGNQHYGVLMILSEDPFFFSDSDRLFLYQSLAEQGAVALRAGRLFDETQETAVRLTELDKLKSEFLANMSHELRTPLNSIIGYAEVMMMGLSGELNDEMEQDVQAIHSSGQHLLHLINDILDLAKIEAGRMVIDPEPIMLSQVADEVSVNQNSLLRKKPIELVQSFPDDLPPVNADRLRLSQVVTNLISNAIKFTESGTITMRGFQTEPGFVTLEVSDTGIGIKANEVSTIFEQFRQVDGSSTRRAEGTGLGLAITRHLVELQGGTIEVESEYGHGSTFRVRLPMAR